MFSRRVTITRRSSTAHKLIFAFWLVAATLAGAMLTSLHGVGLPVPAIAQAQSSSPRGHWLIQHYLSPDCACSRRVAGYLVRRHPLPGVEERVLLIEMTGPSAWTKSMLADLTAAHFAATVTDSASAARRAHIEAVPALEIHSPDGRPRYLGGYRKFGTPLYDFKDVAILADLRASKPVETIGVLGCATSDQLRNKLNPFSALFSRL